MGAVAQIRVGIGEEGGLAVPPRRVELRSALCAPLAGCRCTTSLSTTNGITHRRRPSPTNEMGRLFAGK